MHPLKQEKVCNITKILINNKSFSIICIILKKNIVSEKNTHRVLIKQSEAH